MLTCNYKLSFFVRKIWRNCYLTLTINIIFISFTVFPNQANFNILYHMVRSYSSLYSIEILNILSMFDFYFSLRKLLKSLVFFSVIFKLLFF